MKFVLGTNAVWWPVTVNRPDPENPGKVIPQRLKVQFLPIIQDDFLAEQERIGNIPGARARAAAEREYLAGTFQDWSDVEDAAGNSIPCTPESTAEALQDGPFRNGLWAAIGELNMGEAARLGN